MVRSACIVCGCLVVVCVVATTTRRDEMDTGVRELLQNFQQNQDLIASLGTRYEIVYPVQLRQDWVRGLSTRTVADPTAHLPQTSFVIETVQFKFHLDLELNTNLLAPTLVQQLYFADSQVILDKTPENCFYHATLRDRPGATAALHTCDGLSGVIYLDNKVFLLHPLRHGNQSTSHPHLLYHRFPKSSFECGNEEINEEICDKDSDVSNEQMDLAHRKKFIELALVIDQSVLEKEKSSPKEVIATAIQIMNNADLLLRPLNLSLSLVYAELWSWNQIPIDRDIETSLNRFQAYAANRFTRISADASHLLTGFSFANRKLGHATVDSICTHKAVALTRIESLFEVHVPSYAMAHGIGHNLGMSHDRECCTCSKEAGCIMAKTSKFQSSTPFSACSRRDLHTALEKGHGACLLNMPFMRTSVCGNGILEEAEQCDCGTSQECARAESCCDPISCRFVKHAECSSGSCCRKCKLLSPDHMCRPSKGECDIPEFCDGAAGQCPDDLYKRNGQVCGEGLGYCYQGTCPVAKRQCQHLWGEGADAADSVCFDRLNVQGTPNGNCGIDAKSGRILKCAPEDSQCGSLHCQEGEKEPVTEEKPIQFVVNKIKLDGTLHECKSKSNPYGDLDPNSGLVLDGTKCGFQKLCVNRSCVKIRGLEFSGDGCPVDEDRISCSGHGVCTSISTCYCDEGWTGADCEVVAPDPLEGESGGSLGRGKGKQGLNEMQLDANLAVTVIAASMLIGIALVAVVVFVCFYGKRALQAGCSNKHRLK